MDWYTLRVISGKEKKIKEAILFDVNTSEMEEQIVVYDMMGRVVSELVSGLHEPGYHEVQWNASQQSSGIYFVKMVAGGQTNILKLMLVK